MHGKFRCPNKLQNRSVQLRCFILSRVEGGVGEMTHAELVEDVKAINKYPGTVQALYSAKSTLTATGHYL